MKIEMPREPDVDRVWTKDPDTGEVVELVNLRPGWQDRQESPYTWLNALTRFKTIYTTHPYAELLAKYPAPWTVGPGGSIRSRGHRVVLDPTLQCPPCLTGFFAYLVNQFAAQQGADAGEDEKR